MASMDDVEIRETCESILGASCRVLDVEKTTSTTNEETLLINGTAVPLIGDAGDVIRTALLNGVAPPADVLAQLLIGAGIWTAPLTVHTTLTTNKTTLNRDTVVVTRRGVVVDERVTETRQEDHLHKTSTEIWTPTDVKPDVSDRHLVALIATTTTHNNLILELLLHHSHGLVSIAPSSGR